MAIRLYPRDFLITTHMVEVNAENGPSQDHMTKNIGQSVRICQLNIEGISRSKCQYLSKILKENDVDILLIQEAHLENDEQARARANIPGYNIIGITFHAHYGNITYARNDIENINLVSTSTENDIHSIAVKMGETTIVNIYKPPGTAWPRNVLPQYQHPAVYSGDFNSHHTEWKYQHNDTNGERLYDWITENNIQLIFDAKERGSFKSRVWNREYNPDLTFVTTSNSGQPIHAQRCILKDFPKSQHRPALTKLGIQIPIIRSFPRPRWNFSKANWLAFSRDLDKCLIWIPPTYKHYKRFVGAAISTAKKHIPRGFRNQDGPTRAKQNTRNTLTVVMLK